MSRVGKILDVPLGIEFFGTNSGKGNLRGALQHENARVQAGGHFDEEQYAGEFLGYQLYRADDWDSSFERVGDISTTSQTWVDGDADGIWMVRAVKCEDTNSGSYINLS